MNNPRTPPATPRGSAGGVNLQQYTPRPKLRPTSPGEHLPVVQGQWLPAFIWMPAAPGMMPTSPPPIMPMQFMPMVPPPPTPPVQAKHDKIDKTTTPRKSDDGTTKARAGERKQPADTKKKSHHAEGSEESSEASFASKIVCSKYVNYNSNDTMPIEIVTPGRNPETLRRMTLRRRLVNLFVQDTVLNVTCLQ